MDGVGAGRQRVRSRGLGSVGVMVAPTARAASPWSSRVAITRGLQPWLIPWTVVHDQHGEHAECRRHRRRDHQRCTAVTLRTSLG